MYLLNFDLYAYMPAKLGHGQDKGQAIALGSFLLLSFISPRLWWLE